MPGAGTIFDSLRHNNPSNYAAGILDFAERWAVLLEEALDNGKTLDECADDLEAKADLDGITFYMYNKAVKILSQTWKYGETLRCWHNIKWGNPEANDLPNATVNAACWSAQNRSKEDDHG